MSSAVSTAAPAVAEAPAKAPVDSGLAWSRVSTLRDACDQQHSGTLGSQFTRDVKATITLNGREVFTTKSSDNTSGSTLTRKDVADTIRAQWNRHRYDRTPTDSSRTWGANKETVTAVSSTTVEVAGKVLVVKTTDVCGFGVTKGRVSISELNRTREISGPLAQIKTQVAADFAKALGEKSAEGLAALFHPDVDVKFTDNSVTECFPEAKKAAAAVALFQRHLFEGTDTMKLVSSTNKASEELFDLESTVVLRATHQELKPAPVVEPPAAGAAAAVAVAADDKDVEEEVLVGPVKDGQTRAEAKAEAEGEMITISKDVTLTAKMELSIIDGKLLISAITVTKDVADTAKGWWPFA